MAGDVLEKFPSKTKPYITCDDVKTDSLALNYSLPAPALQLVLHAHPLGHILSNHYTHILNEHNRITTEEAMDKTTCFDFSGFSGLKLSIQI